MQNVPQGYKVKVAKFHFIILWHFGVIKEKPQAGGESWYDRVKLEKLTPGALVYHTKFLEIY